MLKTPAKPSGPKDTPADRIRSLAMLLVQDGGSLMVHKPTETEILRIVEKNPKCWTPELSADFSRAVKGAAGMFLQNAAAEYVDDVLDNVQALQLGTLKP